MKTLASTRWCFARKQLSVSEWKFCSEKGNAPFFWALRCAFASKHGWLLYAYGTQKPFISLGRGRFSIVCNVWCWDPWSVQSPAKEAHISISHAFARGLSASVDAERSYHPPSSTHSWENRRNSHIDHQDHMYLSMSLSIPFYSSPCTLAPWQLWSSIHAAVEST